MRRASCKCGLHARRRSSSWPAARACVQMPNAIVPWIDCGPEPACQHCMVVHSWRHCNLQSGCIGSVLSTGEGIANENNGPDAMFSLAAVKGAQAAQRLADAAVPDEGDAAADSLSESDADEDASESDEDGDDARRSALRLIVCWRRKNQGDGFGRCRGVQAVSALACKATLVSTAVFHTDSRVHVCKCGR